jgi:hypothetical protein
MGFCPGFWEWIDSSFAIGKVASISMVYREITEYGDELSKWAKERPEQFVSVEDIETQKFFASIAEHVMALELPKINEKIRFLEGADPWLIAKAATSGFTIVTHEVVVPSNSQKIKIPNICQHFNVPYISSFDLLDTLNAKFVMHR